MIALIVFLGAGLGGVARYTVGMLLHQPDTAAFPWATLLVNVTGSFLLGLLYMVFEGAAGSPEWRAFLGVGFCGGYTTFSAFSFETARMLEGGDWNRAGIYAAASVLGCVLATFAGFRLGSFVRA